MKQYLNILLMLICCSGVRLFGQSLLPLVINAAGGTGTVATTQGNAEVVYNIGETFYTDESTNPTGSRFTQGFLQPEIIAYAALGLNVSFGSISCNGATDGYIALNPSGPNKPYTYKWFKDGALLADSTAALENLSAGSYSYTVADSYGNVKTGEVSLLNSSKECEIIIHNGVSANQDGHNDFFHIERIQNYANTVSIFNRWGDLVWTGNDYDNSGVCWKGQDKKGKMLTSGTYYYVVEYNNKKRTGWVELVY